jgi:hypothetical protein
MSATPWRLVGQDHNEQVSALMACAASTTFVLGWTLRKSDDLIVDDTCCGF